MVPLDGGGFLHQMEQIYWTVELLVHYVLVEGECALSEDFDFIWCQLHKKGNHLKGGQVHAPYTPPCLWGWGVFAQPAAYPEQ